MMNAVAILSHLPTQFTTNLVNKSSRHNRKCHRILIYNLMRNSKARQQRTPFPCKGVIRKN